jgi:uncharacterized protein (DUF1778 family)
MYLQARKLQAATIINATATKRILKAALPIAKKVFELERLIKKAKEEKKPITEVQNLIAAKKPFMKEFNAKSRETKLEIRNYKKMQQFQRNFEKIMKKRYHLSKKIRKLTQALTEKTKSYLKFTKRKEQKKLELCIMK